MHVLIKRVRGVPGGRLRSWERVLRNLLGWGAFVTMTLFYVFPIAIIQSLLQVQKLSNVKGLGTFVQIPFIAAILTAVLPGERSFRRATPKWHTTAGRFTVFHLGAVKCPLQDFAFVLMSVHVTKLHLCAVQRPFQN